MDLIKIHVNVPCLKVLVKVLDCNRDVQGYVHFLVQAVVHIMTIHPVTIPLAGLDLYLGISVHWKQLKGK